MPTRAPSPRLMNVYIRWRPLAESEAANGQFSHSSASEDQSPATVTVRNQGPSARSSSWTSGPAFDAILGPDDDNASAYATIVSSAIPRVIHGGSSGFFAYGHSGSGKTHTILGYDYENPTKLGLCLAAARQIYEEINSESHPSTAGRLGIGFSLFEMRKNSAFDLLNNRTECHVREGPDGKTHIRGPTETLEGGKVRVRPIMKSPCWTFENFRRELITALGHRAVGSSTIHDQSSRTHAILELEIINEELMEARNDLVERQSELVPVGKRADDIGIEEQGKGVMRTANGQWVPNPDYQVDQARIDKAEAERAEFQARVTAAEEHISKLVESHASSGVGGKMIFVDLAGAEYQQEKTLQVSKQTPQEHQEGRQINTDLLALKEVMRAWSKRQTRIPFRSSPLTMVLREHFNSHDTGSHAMILTVSPAKEQFAATLNSLKYGSLVGSGK